MRRSNAFGRLPEASLVLILSLSFATTGLAEERVRLQGLADVEGWNTGEEYGPLHRNDGEAAGLGRLRLWAVGQFSDRLQGFALGELEGGHATYEDETEVDLQQAWLRYSFDPSRRLVIQAGKLIQPIGGFSTRYFSNRNPLIGNPINYDVSYPVGIQVTGAFGPFDYVASVTDKPIGFIYGEDEPSSSPRPAAALGYTPITGLRFGAYYTGGTYLASEQDEFLPSGTGWKDYDQQVAGLDVAFSRGHFELHGEWTQSRYDVPGDEAVDGGVYYLEPKITWSPRWFTALRLERGRLMSVEYDGTEWGSHVTNVRDAEAGVGFRIDPRFLVKSSYRLARTEYYGETETQRAFAVQLSYSFDVNSWFQRPL